MGFRRLEIVDVTKDLIHGYHVVMMYNAGMIY